jgi:amino acid transporter
MAQEKARTQHDRGLGALAIPAALVLFAAGGLLLNFGAHWYYLGYRRKGMSKTIVWAITLIVFSVVVFLSSVLGMNLLAGLLAFILLVPLAVIQIIGLVKDFFALQKIANKKARGRKQRMT